VHAILCCDIIRKHLTVDFHVTKKVVFFFVGLLFGDFVSGIT